MKRLLIGILIILIVNIALGQNKELKTGLQQGDLLFRLATAGNLSEAIDRVTQTDKSTHFSHIGMVESAIDTVWVLHASPKGGACRIALVEFLHPHGKKVTVAAYRLKKEWQNTVPSAIKRTRAMLGKPYNFSYILSDTAHYCSEFVYKAFAPDSVFMLNPMTFKDPGTGEFYPGWEDYYQKLGIKVPEGMPGCNPNGMAASEKLEYLGIVR